MLAIMLIFCEYARTYVPFSWLIMLKRGNYVRSRLCLFLLPGISLLAYHYLCNYFVQMARFPPFIRCFARDNFVVSEHSCFACIFLFYNVGRHHILLPKNLPRDRRFLRRVLRHTAYTLSENDKCRYCVPRIDKLDKRKRTVLTAKRHYTAYQVCTNNI